MTINNGINFIILFCIFWTTNKCLSIMMSLFMLSLILCKSCFIFELRLNGLSLHVQNFIVIGPLLNMSKKPSPIKVNAKASKPLQEELATISWSSKGIKVYIRYDCALLESNSYFLVWF